MTVHNDGVMSSNSQVEKKSAHREEEKNISAVSALQLHTFLDAMDGGVCLLELREQIRLIYASSGFYQMLGREEEKCTLPCGLEKIGIHPDYFAEYVQMLRDVGRKGGEIKHLQRIAGKGKEWIWRRCKAIRLSDFPSEYPVVLEMSTDVTEPMKTEEQLRESNERLRVAFEQMPHVLWEVDIDKKTYSRFNVNTQCCDQNTIIESFPEALIDVV